MMRLVSRCSCAALLLSLSACITNKQSAIDPAGAQADRISTLWWSFFWLLGIIFVLVMITTFLTLVRRRNPLDQRAIEETRKAQLETEHRLRRNVTVCTILTILILFVLIFASVGTGRSNAELSTKPNPITIQVTGTQWWWQIQYMNSEASLNVITANEIHIPVGRPVQIRGISNDVIHSFWVPNLNGKRDLIPSRVTSEWIEADHPGDFRGQCAEFCGLQHAHMSIWVIAEPEDKFEAWFRNELHDAVAPATRELQQGQQVFLNHECIFCHQIRGTTAGGQSAPDLTHFGGRRGIAANTLPNTKGNLAGWILDPQSIKAGNHMATVEVSAADLHPLIDYLESLK